MYAYIYIYIYICDMCKHLCVYTHVCMYVCMYVCMPICIYIYIYIRASVPGRQARKCVLFLVLMLYLHCLRLLSCPCSFVYLILFILYI